jgi:hypothetical protein
MTPLGIFVAGVLALWVGSCARYPYVTCTHCEGEKRDWDSGHEHFRDKDCMWCLGEGRRYRWELRWLTIF